MYFLFSNNVANALHSSLSRRFNFTNHVRKLTEGDWSSQNDDEEEEEVEEEEESEEMEVEVRLRRPGQNYKSQVEAKHSAYYTYIV